MLVCNCIGTVVNMPYYLRIHVVWSLLLAVGAADPPWVSSLERKQHQMQEIKLVTDQSQGCSKTYLLQEKTKCLKMVWRLWHHISMHMRVVESLLMLELFQFEINLISFLSFGAIYSYLATWNSMVHGISFLNWRLQFENQASVTSNQSNKSQVPLSPYITCSVK